MPATAPYSRVASVTGNVLTVLADEGAKFTAPFDALIWAVQMAPRARGIDSTEIKVTAVDGDNLTFIPTDAFEIVPGLMIGVLSRQDIYVLGDVVTLTGTFVPPNDSAVSAGKLHIQGPQGDLTVIEGTALHIVGPGDYYFDFTPPERGGWKAQWEAATGARSATIDFFVGMDSL